jgi:hypothetical protein
MQHSASFVDDGGPPRHPVNIGMLVEDLRDRNEGARFVTVVGIDPGHQIRIAAGRKTAIDRIIESAIGLARKRKLYSRAINREVVCEAVLPRGQ